jgi:hypothetical protein
MRMILAGAALVAGLSYAQWVRADDRCAATRAMPGAVERVAMDVLVVAPDPRGVFRLCYWNSPNSMPARYIITIEGVELSFYVQVTGEAEIVHIDTPGVIVTDLDGVPVPDVRALDSLETTVLLVPWLM